jgi:OmpA-OmpF porin, OOP family
MKKLLLPAIVFVFLSAATSGAAEPPVLTPEPARISDRSINADTATINALQKRLADLNTQGTSIGSYQFAKAQAWLDMAMDEYSMNDRTSAAEDALVQASRLIEQLEAKKKDMDMETVILPTSCLVRPDLWKLARELKNNPGFSCGEDLVARLEVQLVWAGHEQNQLGWRNAKPYLQAAERLAGEARRKIEACPVVLPVAADTNAGTIAVVAEKKVTETVPAGPAKVNSVSGAGEIASPTFGEQLADRVHFALNSDLLSSRSAAVLERLVVVMRANPGLKVELQGHADERGSKSFNLNLSRKRAEVVRVYLIAAGIDGGRITVKAFGDSQPLTSGNDIGSYARNRRVEFVIAGGDDHVRLFAQDEDLRIEEKRANRR